MSAHAIAHALLPAVALAIAAPAEALEKPPGEIVVVKRAGIAAYAEVAEEFGDRCRVRARVININLDEGRVDLRRYLHAGDVVLAVGQRALQAVLGSPARVVAALASDVPPGIQMADQPPPPDLVLRALRAARPSLRRVGVVLGPRSERLLPALREAAQGLGLELSLARAKDGPHAVRELHRIVDGGPSIDALLLPADVDVLTPQLFQYALTLEIQRALPVAAPTRQLVRSGALLAIDADPRVVGHRAAEIANRMLAGAPPDAAQSGFELIVNTDVARRLGVDGRGLRVLGARFE